MTNLAPFTLNPANWRHLETQMSGNTAMAALGVHAATFVNIADEQQYGVTEHSIVTYWCVISDFGDLVLSRAMTNMVTSMSKYPLFMAEARQTI